MRYKTEEINIMKLRVASLINYYILIIIFQSYLCSFCLMLNGSVLCSHSYYVDLLTLLLHVVAAYGHSQVHLYVVVSWRALLFSCA
jgi:hypothetical protein